MIDTLCYTVTQRVFHLDLWDINALMIIQPKSADLTKNKYIFKEILLNFQTDSPYFIDKWVLLDLYNSYL